MSRRSAEDNPLVALFSLVPLVVVGGGGIWYAIREKPRVDGRYAGQSAELTAREGRSQPVPPGSQRFVESFKRLPADATALQKAADAEYDGAIQSLGVEEYGRVEKLLARKNGGREAYSESDLDTLRRLGFGKWLRAQAVRWSQDDPAFKTTSEAVWGRSPNVRDEGLLTDLAARWGEMDRATRLRMFQLIKAVEAKSRELSD